MTKSIRLPPIRPPNCRIVRLGVYLADSQGAIGLGKLTGRFRFARSFFSCPPDRAFRAGAHTPPLPYRGKLITPSRTNFLDAPTKSLTHPFS